MSAFLQLAFMLIVILLAAKLAGYLSLRLGQPSVLGELLIGILLGPSLLDILHLSFLDGHALGELGVLLPVALGWGTGALFGFHTEAAFFLGLTLAATSVSISAQTLIELKALRSRVGLGLLAFPFVSQSDSHCLR